MPTKIEFSGNYNDLSTQQGFQFEFICSRCNNGIRTSFKPSITGAASGVLEAASSLLGGLFSSASDMAGRVNSATWERAHDQAFVAAFDEIKPDFIQCPRCQSWVCRAKCWNPRKGLCKNCAPDLAVEASAAQASKTVQDIWAGAQTAEEDKPMTEAATYKQVLQATCPQCEAPLPQNVKFCPECGAKISAESKCKKCGAKLMPNAKFCPECGQKV